MTYRFLTPALQEVSDAAEYYDSQFPDLGIEFVEELDSAISRIVRFPSAWALLAGDFRHCSLLRFPYSVIYTVDIDDSILIVSVFHQTRQPLSWQENL